MNKFFKDAADFTLSKTITPLILLIPIFILGRFKETKATGAFLLMATSMSFITMISTQWMHIATIRNYVKFNWSFDILAASLMPTYFISMTALSFIWFATKAFHFSYPFGETEWTWVVGCILIMNTYTVLSGVSLGAGLIRIFSAVEVIRGVSYATGVIAAVVYFNDSSLFYRAFMCSYILACISICFLIFPKLELTVNSVQKKRIQIFIKEQVSYGLPFMIWFFGSQLLAVADRYLIDHFMSKTDVGVYTICYQVATNAIMLISGPIVGACHINAVRLMNTNSEKLWEFTSKSTVLFTVVMSPVVLVIPILGPLVTKTLFGKDMAEAGSLLFAISLGQVVWGLSMIIQKKIELEKKFHIMFICLFIAITVNVTSNYLCIPKFGYIAAGWATFFSYLVYASCIATFSHRLGFKFYYNLKRINFCSIALEFFRNRRISD